MFILVIITTLVTLFITSSWRRITLTNMVEDVNRSVLVSIDRFDRDISESSSTHVTIDTVHSAVFFPSPRDVDGAYRTIAGGEPDWCCWILYYLYPDGASQTTDGRQLYLLARKRVSGELASPPGAGEPGNLNGASVVARNITAFSVVMENPSSSVNYRVTVRAAKVYGGRDCSFELEKVIAVKSFI
jgi:hypothetical protein